MKIVVEPEKITRYLLNIDHPDGYSKARFFIACGFRIENYTVFKDSLIAHFLDNHEAAISVQTDFGEKLILTGLLETPKKGGIKLKSIWFQPINEDCIKLVTAYPL